MHKIAVIGAGTLIGRELVKALEFYNCSVLPLSSGSLSRDEEVGDLVIFEPHPSLLEDIDVVILTAPVNTSGFLDNFTGRILDFCVGTDSFVEAIPLTGSWPGDARSLRTRPVLEQVLSIIPRLVGSVDEVSGTHLQSVAYLGDRGIDGLMDQTVSILKGEDPDCSKLGYRGAFEIVPCVPLGRMMQIMVPAFHGDLLILHIRAAEGQRLFRLKDVPRGVMWVEHPPTSREVGVSSDLLAFLNITDEGKSGILTLGFDPILWGVLLPVVRLLDLSK